MDCALSKVQWSHNGQLLAVGDIEGTIHIYEAGEVSSYILIDIAIIILCSLTKDDYNCVHVSFAHGIPVYIVPYSGNFSLSEIFVTRANSP